MLSAELALKFLIRFSALVSMSAVVAVVMPFSWMDQSHQWLGLGKAPHLPMFEYLARSTSAFYALLGGSMWIMSMDLKRYRPIIAYYAWAHIAFGCAFLYFDRAMGLPSYWTWSEGPSVILLGIVILLLQLRIGDQFT